MVPIEPPRQRQCERCGRQETWHDERETWVAASEERDHRGEPHCVHVWNITGSYNPLSGNS